MTSKLFLTVCILCISSIILAQDFQLVPYRVKDEWGFSDAEKNLVIKPKYEDVTPFNYGYAAFKLNNKWGVLNAKGDFILKPYYDSVDMYPQKFYVFSEGIGNKEVLGIRVFTKGEWTGVDFEGNPIELQELSIVEDDIMIETMTQVYKENGKFGLRTNDRSKMNTGAIFDEVVPIRKKYTYLCRKGKKWGIYDETLERSVEPKYESIKSISRYYIIEEDGCFGVMASDFEVIVQPIYHKLIPTQDNSGFYFITKEGKKGFVSTWGKEIVEAKYADLEKIKYKRNEFRFSHDGTIWGYIRNGVEAIQAKYHSIQPMGKSYFLVTNAKGQKGYVNENGVEFFE